MELLSPSAPELTATARAQTVTQVAHGCTTTV